MVRYAAWGFLSMVSEFVFYVLCCAVGTFLVQGCTKQPEPPTSFSTPPGQFAFPEKPKDVVILQDGQSLELLEDTVVRGRIPFFGDELYIGEVKIKAGSMIVKPKDENGPIRSTPLPQQEVPMTREEKVKRFQLAGQ